MFGPNIQRYQFKKPIPKKPKQQPVATQSTLSASMAPPPPRSVPEDTSSSSSSGIGEKKVVRRAGPAMPSMADLEEAKVDDNTAVIVRIPDDQACTDCGV